MPHSAPNLRHVTVIGKADWSRINNQLNKAAIQAEKQRKQREEKQRLRDLSKETVKNWSNTIAVCMIHFQTIVICMHNYMYVNIFKNIKQDRP